MQLRLALPDVRRQTRSWVSAHMGSLLFVALPTLLSAIYFGLFAADIYASEARFVVRSPSQLHAGGVLGFLQGGASRAESDVHSVHDFMLSRDAIATLQEKIDLRELFSRPEADFIAAYPGLLLSRSDEDLYKYYQRRVDVIYDATTGIAKLEVQAFRREDAQLLANQLLTAAEDMINRLNDRARTATVRDSETQVKLGEQRVADAEAALLEYRNRETLIDPSETSTAMFEELSQMQAQLIDSRMQFAQLQRTAPDSPFLTELSQNITQLEQVISQQRARLAGSKGSMAPKIAEFGQLILRQKFAAKELTSALASLEAARAEARQQKVYLERVVDAGLPDEAQYPRRLRAIFVTLVSCFLIYSVSSLLIVGVREHGQV